MSKKDPAFLLLLYYAIGAVVAILALAFLVSVTGCEVLKTKRQVYRDTVVVSRVDSLYVNKTDYSRKDSFEFWRAILDYRKGDTTINNYYTTNPKPQVVILEGGKGSSQTVIQQVDSGYRAKYDSLRAVSKEESKSKETKVLGFWQIIGLAAGVSLVLILLSKLKISVK